MELEEIIVHLADIKDDLVGKLSRFECYLFGSILTSNYPNDIDILILYDNPNDILLFKKCIKPDSLNFPLDILYLTFEEEKQFNFIQEQNAIKIFSL